MLNENLTAEVQLKTIEKNEWSEEMKGQLARFKERAAMIKKINFCMSRYLFHLIDSKPSRNIKTIL